MPSDAGCGKIKYCMDIKIIPETERPPRMAQALLKGFNTIANHVYLLIFPFILDLFLWLGPNLSTTQTLSAFLDLMEKSMQEQLQQPGVIEQFRALQPGFNEFINSFNLFGFLNTSPIGIPSLMAFQSIFETPLGLVQKINTGSILEEFFYFLVILVTGSVLGAIFFSEIGRLANNKSETTKFSLINLLKDVLWLVMINFGIWLLIIIILFPGLTVVVFLTMINGVLGNIVNFIFLLVLFWMMIPLIFTPHGVIIQRQNPIKAMLSSIRLIRFYLPGTGFFILFSYLIYQGLNQLLWLQPKFSSIMLLGGIFGHAFICAGLIASSFYYYQDGYRWMNHNLKMIAQQQPNQTNRPFQA